MQTLTVVVMFCGPFYDGDPYHYGRLMRAIRLAKQFECPLLICGDGTRGMELEHFKEIAAAYGVREIRTRYNGKQNTLGDAISAAAVLAMYYPQVDKILLVTDWYHMLRAWVRLVKKLYRRGMTCWPTPAPVWQHARDGFRRLPGELRGAFAALIGRPQRSNKSKPPRLYVVKNDNQKAS